MNVSDQINSVINNLTEKLGVAADKLYPVLVKQVYVDGIKNIVGALIGLLLIIAAIFLVKTFKKKWSKSLKEYDKQNYECVTPLAIIGIVIVFIAGITILTICTTQAMCRFINPDWYALQMVLNQIK